MFHHLKSMSSPVTRSLRTCTTTNPASSQFPTADFDSIGLTKIRMRGSAYKITKLELPSIEKGIVHPPKCKLIFVASTRKTSGQVRRDRLPETRAEEEDLLLLVLLLLGNCSGAKVPSAVI